MKYVLILLAAANFGCAGFARALNEPMPQQQSFAVQPVKQTDQVCMERCTSAGSIYNFCQSKCSY